MATLTGRTLGKYRVGERIGRGGMAEVYEGVHPTLHRKVAIKVLHPHLMESEDFTARFEREARAAAALRHPNIVQVYDFDVEDEIVYMVMEFIDGGSLKDHMQDQAIRKGYLPLEEVAGITRQVDRALDYAHQRGLVHRDVKPSNILLDEDGNAFLTDFGIVRIVSDTQFTNTGALIGTPHYMSPEQGRGETLTASSDIYSMGVILYEMLVGAPPFDADTPLAIIHKHNNDPVPHPRALRPDLPKAVEAVVIKALSKQPEDRFPSSGALSVALDGALELSPETVVVDDQTHLGIQPDTAPSIEPSRRPLPPTLVEEPPDGGEPGTTLMPEIEAGEQPEKTSTRRWIPMLVGGVAVIAIIALLALSGVFRSGVGDGECPNIEGCLAEAQELMAVGEYQSAVDRFDRVIGMIPAEERTEHAEVMCDRGDALMALELPDAAMGSYQDCLIWAGDSPVSEDITRRAEEMLAELQPQGGECSDMEACLAAAFELMEAGEYEAAVGHFDRAIEMTPPDAPLQLAENYCNLGHAFLAMNAPDEAIRSFEACLEITGDAPEAEDLRQHARETLAELGSGFEECSTLDICAAMAYEALDVGNFEVAIDHFNRAAEMVPPDERPLSADLMCSRGHAFLELGMMDPAIESFDLCLAWAGDSPEAADIRQHAEEMLAELLNQ